MTFIDIIKSNTTTEARPTVEELIKATAAALARPPAQAGRMMHWADFNREVSAAHADLAGASFKTLPEVADPDSAQQARPVRPKASNPQPHGAR